MDYNTALAPNQIGVLAYKALNVLMLMIHHIFLAQKVQDVHWYQEQ